MRRVFFALPVLFSLVLMGGAALYAQGAPPQGAADQPYTVEYYYKVQWGHQQEFLDLFLKNHYPLLKKIVSTGADAVCEDRSAGVSHDRGWPVGLSCDDPLQRLNSGDNGES